ncbi:MAG: 4-alpha-glucanotransferase, partial [Treponema sp.]|nr:4-alpha-glucanotransferase [Treponema sp.]
LNDQEKEGLEELFAALNKSNEKLWKKQADEIFTALTSTVKMVPCGEDLGVGIACVPKTMKAHDILGLRVVRWSREWAEEGQPYVPFEDYEPLSVTTTSVHDSSTIRQWWNTEKESAQAFIKANLESFEEEYAEFTPETAEKIMKLASSSASQWHISPLQDFLFMEEKYWLENADDERINIPGTVTAFNWTYRIPVSIEDLMKNKKLIEKINTVSKR